MVPVVMMGYVYAMITTMELTARVNQYFCYFIVNIVENVILLHQNLKLMQQLLFFFVFDSCM